MSRNFGEKSVGLVQRETGARGWKRRDVKERERRKKKTKN